MPGPSKDIAPNAPQTEQSGCLSLVARIIWLVVGNLALMVLTGLIIAKRAFSFIDVVFWAVVAVILFVRYADIKWLKGLGPDAQPTTMKDWGRHARLLFILSGGVWVIAHVVLLLLRR